MKADSKMQGASMDITTLENWLWEAACSIRGPLDAPKYKDYILPLLFYKRLSDVYEDELGKLSQEFGDEALARQLAQEDRALIRFYIPNGYTWPGVRRSPVRLGKVHYPLRLWQQQKPPLTELGGFAFAMLREDDRDRLSLRQRCRVAAHGEVRSVALG
jgi:hypothetical protein